MTKVNIEWQVQFGFWRHYQMVHHLPSAYKTAKFRSKTMKKRMRLTFADSAVYWT